MNRNLFIGLGAAIAILVMVFFIFRHPSSNIRNYPFKAGPIIAFGDSLVAGSGATQGNDFISIVSRKLGKPIENLGVPGNTSTDALARIDEVVKKAPSVVLVLLGGNDFLRRVPRDTTFTNLRDIIAKIQASGAAVVLIGVRDGLIFAGSADYQALAAETHSAYVSDVLDGLFGDPKYMADEIHPNDAGNLLIAGRVYPVLRDLLRR